MSDSDIEIEEIPLPVMPSVAAAVSIPTTLGVQSLEYQQAYTQLRSSLGAGTITADNYVLVIWKAMECVDTFGRMTGRAKRELVSALVAKFIQDMPVADADAATRRDEVANIVAVSLPAICESVIAATKRQINVNARVQVTADDAAASCCIGWRRRSKK